MSKSSREKILRYATLFGAAVAASTACDRPQYTYSDDVPISGSGTISVAGGSSTIGGGLISIGGSAPTDPCQLDRLVGAAPVVAKQVVSNSLAGRSELYAELTDAEADSLKKGGSLLPPSSSPPGVTSPLMSVLKAANAPTATGALLVQQLQQRFKVTRSAWPNPWALRLIDHAGSQHMNPLRIRLKDEAWIARVQVGTVAVVDVKNAPVSLESALAQPERIAAVYYVYDDHVPGAQCDDARREFALGNEGMVAEFSLGTPEILARLNADIEDLTALFNVVRPCMSVEHGAGTFHSYTACTAWDYFSDMATEYTAYQWSLSDPVELYKPTTQNLAGLIEALKNDRFEPDPFIAAPGSQPGEGGMGGAGGGAAGEGGAAQGGAGQGGAP